MPLRQVKEPHLSGFIDLIQVSAAAAGSTHRLTPSAAPLLKKRGKLCIGGCGWETWVPVGLVLTSYVTLGESPPGELGSSPLGGLVPPLVGMPPGSPDMALIAPLPQRPWRVCPWLQMGTWPRNTGITLSPSVLLEKYPEANHLPLWWRGSITARVAGGSLLEPSSPALL